MVVSVVNIRDKTMINTGNDTSRYVLDCSDCVVAGPGQVIGWYYTGSAHHTCYHHRLFLSPVISRIQPSYVN